MIIKCLDLLIPCLILLIEDNGAVINTFLTKPDFSLCFPTVSSNLKTMVLAIIFSQYYSYLPEKRLQMKIRKEIDKLKWQIKNYVNSSKKKKAKKNKLLSDSLPSIY